MVRPAQRLSVSFSLSPAQATFVPLKSWFTAPTVERSQLNSSQYMPPLKCTGVTFLIHASGHRQSTALLFAGLVPGETLALEATSEVLAALMVGMTRTLEGAGEGQRLFDKRDLLLTQFAKWLRWKASAGAGFGKKSLLEDQISLVLGGGAKLTPGFRSRLFFPLSF